MYPYKEALSASLDYFSGDELVATTFLNKYALKDKDGNLHEKTPHDMHDRLAREFARIDKEKYGIQDTYARYRDALDKFARIVPQGSPMSAIGNPFQVMSASNCVVIESPTDSIGGIMHTSTELAQLYKRRCGVGIDISTLRPDGMPVNNAARTTSGAWSFADLYSFITRMVGQSGRRGALMLTLDIHHPDVEKFATMKKNLTKVTGANVSIRISDAFMIAVENDTLYEQRWPLQGDVKFSRMVPAKQVWNTIIECATAMAEPGIVFWDKLLKYTPTFAYPAFHAVSTNPCCFSTKNTVMVLTRDGLKEIKSISSSDEIWIDSDQCWAKTSGFFNAGKHDVFRISFSNGESFDVTDNHKFEKISYSRQGTKLVYDRRCLIETKDLRVGDKISVSVEAPDINWPSNGSMSEGLILGWLTGDGCLSFRNSDESIPTMYLSFWEKEYDVAEKLHKIMNNLGYDISLVKNQIKNNMVLRLMSSPIVKDLMEKYNFNVWKFKVGHNPFLYSASRDFVSGYLSAYFSADGSVAYAPKQSRWSISLSSIDRERLLQVKNLLTLFGIKSSLGLMRSAGNSTFDGLSYKTKDCYRITISGISNLKKFYENIGFISNVKHLKLKNALESSTGIELSKGYTKIVSIDRLDEQQEVGCIEVEGYHKFTANGIISGNSEIPLCPNDSCRLISLNLTGYVRHPFGQGPYFDLGLFREDIATAVRMSDNLVDIEIELIDKILERCEDDAEKSLWKKLQDTGRKGRRVGLGTHALADTLAMLKLRYDSDEALRFCDLVYMVLRDKAYAESVNLAKERGPFVGFDWEAEKDNEFIKELPDHIKEDMSKYGRRNIALLTNAPTGTVSMMSKVGKYKRHNTSSGIEPVWRVKYKRRRKGNPGDLNFRTDFIDELGDAWMEFDVKHSNLINWEEEFGLNSGSDAIPDYFVSSDEIDWRYRVKLQGVIQKYIDHAISSTINLPKGTSPDVVGGIYMDAWKNGLKGVTVYVDGSRSGVLVTDSSNRPTKVKRQEAPKRPKELPCELHWLSYKGKKWLAAVGLLDNEPYEMFAILDDGSIKHNISSGILVKSARGKYSLVTEGGTIKNIAPPEFGWATRLISTSLRHGVPIDFLVEQLNKDGTSVDLNRVLSRALKKYIREGKIRSSATCPTCNSSNLAWKEGCMTCVDCGHSKCG